ncbi:uncharacterized protein LOC128955699 [Oppia nitens]|uniref:uncharacterized protein LOC128955699 n=1 Tax=Oppia nitens TaxID=1686743 RepID=UPI0023DB66AB|nr:uncharacterized protein LOC128955699 [Oppia nitens]
MNINLIIMATIMVIVLTITTTANGMKINQYYQSDDSEVEFVTGSPNDSPSGGPRSIFKDWMKFIQGFFSDGNWDNGGPSNFGQFIGNQVSKLIEMLTRDDNWFNRS